MFLITTTPRPSPEATVLLAEDNDDARRVYSTYLTHVGYRVREARNGADALAIAQSEPVDLILMDIGLPVLDGWDATRRLKADERTRNIPVVALTAYALPADAATAAEVGCIAFLPKPCTPREVVVTIRRVLADLAPRTAGSGEASA
jgi:two-component system cell cycle response regulator DivK